MTAGTLTPPEATTGNTTTRQQVLAVLAAYRRAHPQAATLLLTSDLAIYAALWLALVLAPAWWMKPPLAALLSMSIARLFVFGHDACHGSAYRSRWANGLAGRLAFLPSLTPFSTWELGHNTLHHGFTNLRGKDYVYTPLSRSEYDALPAWRRALERAYRHPLGPGLCYFAEVWWKKLWFPRRPEVEQVRGVYVADSLLTLGFLLAQSALAWWLAGSVAAAAIAVLAPFAGWNALMGFVTYMHHTHPGVVWYAKRSDWDPVAAQIDNTVHVEFPPLVGALLGNIMEHTAHHLDVRIPLFELPAAQQAVEAMFGPQVIRVPWSWRGYVEACRACQLFDYENRRWLRFDGHPNGSG